MVVYYNNFEGVIMVINKYESNMSDVRFRNALSDYITSDDVDEKISDMKKEMENNNRLLEEKVKENEEKTNDILKRILLCIKILFVLVGIIILFAIIFAVSYIDLRDHELKELNEYGYNDIIEYTIGDTL